jgi:hypothetical protein
MDPICIRSTLGGAVALIIDICIINDTSRCKYIYTHTLIGVISQLIGAITIVISSLIHPWRPQNTSPLAPRDICTASRRDLLAPSWTLAESLPQGEVGEVAVFLEVLLS